MKLKIALFAGILIGLGMVLPGVSSKAFAQVSDDEDPRHIISLSDVDIQILIDDVSIITGYTFNVHPGVRGNVTVTSQVPMSTRDVFQVFLSTLRVNGYAAVPFGRNFYNIVPEEVAVLEGNAQSGNSNRFETAVIRLDHFSAVEAAKMIKPLLGPQGQVTASPASNAIIVVEYGSNLSRVRALIGEIDEDRSVTKTIALQTVAAAEMQAILSELQGGVDGGGRSSFTAIAAEASNSIILRGDADYVSRSEALVKQLDVRSGLRRETRVLRLSHTDAASILPILQEIAAGAAAEEGAAAGSSANTSIALHAPSNALIISAVPETLSALSRVVAELDTRLKQVLVEAIIVDVSDTAVRELGLQFLVAGENGNIPFASSTSSSAPNLLALTGALASGNVTDSFGESGTDLVEQAAVSTLLGLTGGTVGFGGQRGGTLFSVILNALETDVETNVLSTPSVMALNNQTALVSVGQEIPISSGQVLGDANLNPFQTTERREIGVILNVTPRIGEDNTIRLDIEQEVSSIGAAIGTVTTDFILNQSQLQTSVIADNGGLIVLGGLIQASDVVDLQQVPLLGDIPGLGRLFRNEQTSRETSNLMIFIRPTIIEDAAGARQATARSYNYIRAQQIIANEGGPSSLDQFVGEVFNGELPDIPADETAREPN